MVNRQARATRRTSPREENDASSSARCRVSVVIIFLNEERFLEEAITSVLEQTYDAWELLLVDDGSTDGSTSIARKYARNFPGKIRYLEHDDHQNRGMSASRNLGLRRADGEYVAFLDADDIWLPHKLSRQVHLLDANPAAAFVYGRTEFWHSWDSSSEEDTGDYTLEMGVTPNALVEPPELVHILLRNELQLPAPSDILFRRTALDQVGRFNEAFAGMYEDIVVLTKICVDHPVYVADEHWFRYRQHPESCVARTEELGGVPAARVRVLTWIEGYFHRSGVNNRQLWRALRRELRPYRHPRVSAMIGTIERMMWRVEGSLLWLAGEVLPASLYNRLLRRKSTS